MDGTFKINPNRKKILDRYQGKITTEIEFNFDMLSGPPIHYLLSSEDVWNMYNISTSVRLAGKPKAKKDKIHQILVNRGFTKVASGTNRVTYKYYNDNSFLLKVAYDKVGRQANIDEFKNQMVFKPYVAKIFEVDPTGVVQVCERVEACTSKVSFESIYPYVYKIRREWFFGDYVWSDIGDDAWMNWGVREGFGPVLLDYPTAIKLDPNKTKCACGGDIAVDEGFNKLICLNCGHEFLASELAKDIENNQIVVEEREGKMPSKFITNRNPEWNASKDDNSMKKAESKITGPVYGVKCGSSYGYAALYEKPESTSTPGKFVVTTGKVKHNNNPKARIPVTKEDKKMDRGYVKDNNRSNNKNNRDNKKPYNNDNRVAYEKYKSVVDELDLAKSDLFKTEEARIALEEQLKKVKEDSEVTINELLAQIQELNSTIAEKDSIIEELNKKPAEPTSNEELEEKVASLKKQLAVNVEVTNTIKSNLEQRDAAYAQLLKENEELKTQTQKITENEVVVDRAEYNGVLSSIDDMTNTIESMTIESSNLKCELGDANHLIDRLNQKIATLEAMNENPPTQEEQKQEEEVQTTEVAESEDSEEYINMEDWQYLTKYPDLYAMLARICEVRDLIPDSDDATKVLTLHFYTSGENDQVCDQDGHPYIIDSIEGVPVNELTMIKTEALEKIKQLAERKADDTVSE